MPTTAYLVNRQSTFFIYAIILKLLFYGLLRRHILILNTRYLLFLYDIIAYHIHNKSNNKIKDVYLYITDEFDGSWGLVYVTLYSNSFFLLERVQHILIVLIPMVCSYRHKYFIFISFMNLAMTVQGTSSQLFHVF